MKKIKTMRIASVLLIAVLLTTSIISGTFAKYVTRGSVEDSARVAKFGVVVEGSGSLFSKTYWSLDKGDNKPGTAANSAFITVESSDDDKLVAPGTKSLGRDDGSLVIGVTGKPEVDVKVEISFGENDSDVFLKAPREGNYLPDMTTDDKTDTFSFADDYYPIVYTLIRSHGNADDIVATGTLADIKAEMKKYAKVYNANTDLAEEIGTFKLTWEWKFENTTSEDAKLLQDQQDTLLGDLAAGIGLTPNLPAYYQEGTWYSLDVALSISISVTQVD